MRKWFNLSENDARYSRKREMFIVVIYDIVSNKRRLKLCNILDGYGTRVQKSCYEILVTASDLSSMLHDIEAFYDEDERDNIIIYQANDANIIKLNQADSSDMCEDDAILYF